MSKASKSSKVNIKSVLLQIQLQQYLPIFQRNEIDFTTFLTLNEQSLKSIGVKNESHCKILLMYIRKLQQLLLTPAQTESHMSSIVENENDNRSTRESNDDELIKDDGQLTVGNNLTALTPITEEEEPLTNVVNEEEINDLTDVTHSNVVVDDQKSQITAPIISDSSTTNSTDIADDQDTNEEQSEDNYTPISLTSRGRKHNSTDDELISAMRRQRGAAVRSTNWRLSMPVTSSELPSYFDVVDRQHHRNKSECHEELPSYSCTVQKSGYILKKNEFSSKGVKSRDRSWKHLYIYLWGTLLRVYKSEPIDFNVINPVREFSMLNAQIGLASDYLKKRNVIRIRVSTGHQFIFQTQSRDECVSWIEVLQSSVNISSTLDEREMPMFITLPTRRRRVNASMITTSSSLSSMNYEGSGTPLINYSLMPVSSSGLTLQQYNEMARELQQVQITGVLPQQQLSW
ncbi:5100_t:CDS:2 [Funneliformis caledonium]|uniref:5100_t:CDS:1 n=1 Tax=Funneliformis caledonium TaxID=1117310 RepID=A0A9N9CRT0_9GLOM|nr:5100_t:CDS:2 [Funneliformis caledonium]